MPPAPNPAKFLMLVMKLAFIISALLFFYVAFTIPTQAQQPATPAFQLAITVIALAADIVGFFTGGTNGWLMRRTANRQGVTPLKQWFAGNILSLACFEACTLFGMVLHFTGARVRLAELLFAVGIASTALWKPGTPPAANEGMPLQS